MKVIKVIIVVIFALASSCIEQIREETTHAAPAAHMLETLPDRIFPFLTLLEQHSQVDSLLSSDQGLEKIRQRIIDRVADTTSRVGDAISICQRFLLTPEEVGKTKLKLESLTETHPELFASLIDKMHQSGHFVMYRNMEGPELLSTAWDDAITAVHSIIETYGMGKAPLYPAIDSISYDPSATSFRNLLLICADHALAETATMGHVYSLSLSFAVNLLEINDRDEAIRFEPLDKGENRKSLLALDTVNWKHFGATAIIVPGGGNHIPYIPLSAWGKMRLRLAALEYHRASAPFIIVSGGFVHPFQTPYNEAEEMKAYLTQRLGIPEHAVLMEPYARHTTTNMRNVGRLLIRYGLPEEMDALVVTDRKQSLYIESEEFRQRCLKELGYAPFENVFRTDAFTLRFRPVRNVLQHDGTNPLDP